MWKELFAIAAIVNSWGHYWRRKKVFFHCDNQSVCDIWRRGSSRSPEVMALVRMLYFCAAKFDINVMIVHIAGSNNTIADALSRFQATRYYQLAPLAAPHPDNILAWPTFLDGLLHEYQSLGVAPSTHHTYRAGVRSYQQFCNQFNIQ